MENEIKKLALRNAVLHGGKANEKSVISSIMSNPKIEDRDKILQSVNDIISEINELSLDEQKQLALQMGVDTERHAKEQREGLPDLPSQKPNGEYLELQDHVITRFAPNPNAPLHLGSARPLVINGLYAKKYNGKFILRFDDTDPGVKRPMKEAYEMIIDDCKWLGFPPDLVIYASDRFELYIEKAYELYKGKAAYICTCELSDWKKLIDQSKACLCRNNHLEDRWEDFITNMKEGEAVLRVKTDLDHKNPAIRDFPILRIKDNADHPRITKKQRMWPMYNLASAIDEHDLGITHIIRGQEHTTNWDKQKYIFDFFGWDIPIALHHGRLLIDGDGILLSKSEIKTAVEEGRLEGWDDPRCATLMSLKRQGISPETIVKMMEKVGVRTNDARIDMKNLYAENRKN